jgi:enolase
MSLLIKGLRGREILDSRGRPTVEVAIRLSDGTETFASVPAGASKSRHEALELRDGDATRYRARGVRKAIANVDDLIGPALLDYEATDQTGIDSRLIELDGTEEKSRLGANAVLAVSLAVARAAALSLGLPLWRYLGGEATPLLPLPMVNIISGGLHASGNVDFQDFLVVPIGAKTYSRALEMSASVYAAASDVLRRQGLSTLKADEGGFGPALPSNAAALDVLVDAVEAAGYRPGIDVSFAIDVAASHFYDATSGRYQLLSEGRVVRADELVAMLMELVERYPIVSIEDGLAEDDWSGWAELTARLGDRVQLVGDDLFATNLGRLEQGIDLGVANAVLVKMNQIGTLTETIAVVQRAQEAGLNPIISARSGDTEDPALADLAVATCAGQIKIGSVAQSERLAKYNQLLRIEEMLGDDGAFAAASTLGLATPQPTERLR